MTDIIAKVVADSIGADPRTPRLLTMFTRSPKMIHQETLRHRRIYIADILRFDYDFSLSVSSARAIPFAKLLAEVEDDNLRASPVFWGSEKKGMSPGAELDDLYQEVELGGMTQKQYAQQMWKHSALSAANFARDMARSGAHKSIVNRIIEPYIHVNALLTASAPGWLNFFGLRLDRAADPILRALAEECWKQWNESTPQALSPSRWHLPYTEDYEIAYDRVDDSNAICKHPRLPLDIAQRMSVARCARLSYLSFETGKQSTIDEDMKLYDRLVGSVPIHASPAEHQATPDVYDDVVPLTQVSGWRSDMGGNLGPGWKQYRKFLPHEAVAPLPQEYQNA